MGARFGCGKTRTSRIQYITRKKDSSRKQDEHESYSMGLRHLALSAFLTLSALTSCLQGAEGAVVGEGAGERKGEIVHQWTTVEYDWPDAATREAYTTSGNFTVTNNLISGIKLYKGEVYLTVPRWRHGVPSTLNKVVLKNGEKVLQPFPSWVDQTVGNCRALQYVQSMEVDPNTGVMWIIDTGRIDFLETSDAYPARNLCPPKLVMYDINKNQHVHTYTFPDEVANHTTCFLNDIVLDYVNGEVQYAYITDTFDAKLYVYDVVRDTSYFFTDPSMRPMTDAAGQFPINGIAMSSHFDYVYYCSLSENKALYQVPTSVLRNRDGDFHANVRDVGTRLSRSDGLTYGQRHLYYGLLDVLGVQSWDVDADVKGNVSASGGGGYGAVTMTTQERLVSGNASLTWVDTFAWDDQGYLWFTANDIGSFLGGSMDFSDPTRANFHVWRVDVGEKSYLAQQQEVNGADAVRRGGPVAACLLACVCLGLRLIAL